MDKLLYVGDQDELVKAAGMLVNFFEDVRTVKSASSSTFSDQMMRSFMPDDQHFGIHLIGLGCGEDYSFNKNGDWWTRDGLKHEGDDYGMGTFVKYGKLYQEHRNKDPKLVRGIIKAAAYNNDMQRGELVVWADKNKAEDTYQRAKAGKTLSFSMSARVPDDECSICQHRAKKSADYCTDLKKFMTQWRPGHKKFAYAINHQPKFFDISEVANPADRIAHWLEYYFHPDEMAKAASENHTEFLFSDLQAKIAGVQLPREIRLGCSTPSRQVWLEKLAAMEEYLSALRAKPNDVPKNERYNFAKHAAAYAFDPAAISDEELAIMRSVDPDVLFHHLIKKSVVLPFLPFYAYVTDQPIKQAAEDPVFLLAQERMIPTMFRDSLKLEADAGIEDLFRPAVWEKVACYVPPDPIQKVMDGVSEKYSVEAPTLRIRIVRICSCQPQPGGCGVKFASENQIGEEIMAKAQTMTHAYAMYKVACTEAMAGMHGQNVVDEPLLLLLAYHHNV
jgi:hypothetical protein